MQCVCEGAEHTSGVSLGEPKIVLLNDSDRIGDERSRLELDVVDDNVNV